MIGYIVGLTIGVLLLERRRLKQERESLRAIAASLALSFAQQSQTVDSTNRVICCLIEDLPEPVYRVTEERIADVEMGKTHRLHLEITPEGDRVVWLMHGVGS